MWGTWGTLIAIFAVAWFIQIALVRLQANHYERTLREMSDARSGYLGVGVDKRLLGAGKVVILVSDIHGTIVKAKEMAGVTLFARFKPADALIGHSVDAMEAMAKTGSRNKALLMAVRNIQERIQSRK